MPDNEKRLQLICYDIADPDRLVRVHRYVSARAFAVQYSVFIADLKRAEVEEVVAGLEELINPWEDDVRIYPLPQKPRAVGLGRTMFPEGVIMVERGADLWVPAWKEAA